MKISFRSIISAIMLIFTALYWIILIGIADSLTIIGALTGILIGLLLALVCNKLTNKFIFKNED